MLLISSDIIIKFSIYRISNSLQEIVILQNSPVQTIHRFITKTIIYQFVGLHVVKEKKYSTPFPEMIPPIIYDCLFP